ncbi:diguanylate cyclase [Lysobacter sp. ISL-50]|uniref:diguanylate cyclase domain-containing protein n=1 Tax=unclassified Lysobacter TaxID=2635362 RepID=UPI0031B9E90A
MILPRVEHAEGVAAQMQRIAQSLRFEFEDRPITLDANIGCAVYPDDGEDLGVLLEKADQAMYRMKRSKKAARD